MISRCTLHEDLINNVFKNNFLVGTWNVIKLIVYVFKYFLYAMFLFSVIFNFFFFYINGKILHTLHGTKPSGVNLGIRREDPTNNKSKQAGP